MYFKVCNTHTSYKQDSNFIALKITEICALIICPKTMESNKNVFCSQF